MFILLSIAMMVAMMVSALIMIIEENKKREALSRLPVLVSIIPVAIIDRKLDHPRFLQSRLLYPLIRLHLQVRFQPRFHRFRFPKSALPKQPSRHRLY